MLPIPYAVFPKEVPRYIDVFGGSGAVLLGKPKSKFEVFNDVDGELVNLFHCIRDRFEEFLVELGFNVSSVMYTTSSAVHLARAVMRK